MILPSKFREELEGGAYIAKSLDGCLAIYPAQEFEALAQSLQETQRRGPTQRRAVRTFAAGAAEATPDRQGRVTVPPNLRTYAGLEGPVVVNGALNRIEIWDAQSWQAHNAEGEQSISGAEEGLEDLAI